MANTVAVKFTLTGDIDFYEEEIGKVILGTDKGYDFLKNQSGVPNVFYQGDLNKFFTVEFIERWATTRAKIDELIDEESEMTMYYEYAYDITKSVSVILVGNKGVKRTEMWKYGEKEALIMHQMRFLQSS